MGLFFSNIQIRRTENELDFAQIAAVLTEGRDLSAVDNEEEADIALSVFTVADSPWITVCSDLIEGDFEELGAKARRLSETLQTQTLALACLDSDYFCMNLIDAANGADLWAANGRMTEGKAPRRSSLAPWKRYVSDIEAFKRTMRGNMSLRRRVWTGLSRCCPCRFCREKRAATRCRRTRKSIAFTPSSTGGKTRKSRRDSIIISQAAIMCILRGTRRM